MGVRGRSFDRHARRSMLPGAEKFDQERNLAL
jgi:hypothetical protein